MRKSPVLLVLAPLLVALAPAPLFGGEDATCREISKMLIGQTFIAKEPLYDTKIDTDGIIDLERDKEEIPKGAQFMVLKIDCGGKKIEITLRQVARVKMEKVDVYFLLSKSERQMPDAIDEFKVMLDHVFEKPIDEED